MKPTTCNKSVIQDIPLFRNLLLKFKECVIKGYKEYKLNGTIPQYNTILIEGVYDYHECTSPLLSLFGYDKDKLKWVKDDYYKKVIVYAHAYICDFHFSHFGDNEFEFHVIRGIKTKQTSKISPKQSFISLSYLKNDSYSLDLIVEYDTDLKSFILNPTAFINSYVKFAERINVCDFNREGFKKCDERFLEFLLEALIASFVS